MTRRQLIAVPFALAGALLLLILLYLAFGDLGRHKGRIEALVSEQTGRPFAIDGALQIEVLPSISVLAERVRLGNAPWGSAPNMVEVGRLSTKIGLWSLVSGPVDVRSFELSDVSVLLEQDAGGTGNWVMGGAAAPEEETGSLGPEAAAIPAVVLSARLANVRVTHRAPGKPDRVALLETATIESGPTGPLAISATGKLGEYAASVTGDVGPLSALLSGRDIRVAIRAALGNLNVDLNGGLGRLSPLDGADLTLKVENPDLGAMLGKLDLPVFAKGPLRVDARLTDAGANTRLDLEAKAGDIVAKVNGTLSTLGLPGSDLGFEASVADAARLAAAFKVSGLPAGPLTARGRVASSRTEMKLAGVGVGYAGAKVSADGTIRVARNAGANVRFQLAAASLATLGEALPAIPVSMSGTYSGGRGKHELKDLKGRIGESDLSGSASIVQARRTRVEADLASRRLDLTPLTTQEDKAPKEAQKKMFVFGEEPLPLDALKAVDAKVRLAVAEVTLGQGVVRDLKGALIVDAGRLTFDASAKGGIDGTLSASLTLAPLPERGADLSLKLVASKVRAGFGTTGAVGPAEVPPLNIEANLAAQGNSPRQMASSANGRFLVTQEPGKVESSLLGMFGGDIINQLFGKLNPFAAQDPYTQLECTVARVEVVDGQATVAPVLMQSEKVTIVAGGKIDLRTEGLKLDFSTRPRKGVGISAGMFTAPFIELAGTLANPRLGVGAKGATAGAAAVATGGVTVIAGGFLDRIRGAKDVCKEVLDQATAKKK